MRKLKYCAAAVLLLSFVVSGCGFMGWMQETVPGIFSLLAADDQPDEEPEQDQPSDPPISDGIDVPISGSSYDVAPVSTREFRAVWVATVLNLDFPSRQGLSADALKAEVDAIVARTAEMGLNAIILQVRPTGDALYYSEIFPWSHWLSGTQGHGIPDFDPLAYWIEVCRAHGIELHAWLNPYRVIHTAMNSSDPNSLAPNHPVRLRPELSVRWATPNGNAGLFLDPGLPDARQLIIDGIAELIRNYDVDGIHIDDYFYPGSNFNDAASFARYGGGLALADWRRENVNELIRGIQAVVSELNEELGRSVRWGISPTAIWKNGSSDPNGVPTTRGQESYHALYADTRRWVMEGWVDYICPQIYWYIGFDAANFEPILNWWIDLCREYGVDLYVGLAAYREHQDDQAPRWRGEMLRQLAMIEESDVTKGSVFFRFGSLVGPVGDSIRVFYEGTDAPPPRRPVMALDTLLVGMPGDDIVFAATPAAAPGYSIAGASDPRRPLFMNGVEVTDRTIEGFFYVFAPLETGENVFVFSQEGQQDVTRRITRNNPSPGTGAPAPQPTVTEITDLLYATVTSDAAWVFPGNTASGGSSWMLLRGQRDRVVAESSNGFLKLSCGMWVNRDHVTLRTESRPIENVLQNGVYRAGADYDMIVWQSDVFAAVYAGFDGQVLTLSFGMQTQVPHLSLPANLSETIFSSVSSGVHNGTPYYAFAVRDDVRFEGHYIDFEDGELRLHLKKRKSLAVGARPLTGITIVLDPGHGGDEYGALGPLGRDLAEKDLNLINTLNLAERLTAMGAAVYLTRSTDVSVHIQQRVDLSRSVKPDMFISLHVNSVAETTNASSIRGFTVWYRNPGSADLARTFLELMHDVNPATNRSRNINQANFFVCRPQWAPSVILEASFIVNIDDFVWLIDPVMQDRMTDATIAVILEYFAPQ